MMKFHGFLTLVFLATVVSAGSSPSALEEGAAAAAAALAGTAGDGRGSFRNIHAVSLFVSISLEEYIIPLVVLGTSK